ncbi:hypothetical protein [Neisseria dentiae]
MMNIVNQLPVPVLPIDRDRADYAVSKKPAQRLFYSQSRAF